MLYFKTLPPVFKNTSRRSHLSKGVIGKGCSPPGSGMDMLGGLQGALTKVASTVLGDSDITEQKIVFKERRRRPSRSRPHQS